MNKIVSLDELTRKLCYFNRPPTKIVQAHGCFDVLHVGHIRHLQQAKSFGDVLIVTITADEYVGKGPNRPIFKSELRAEVLAALRCVDYVYINTYTTGVESIKLIRPDIFVKGAEAQRIRTEGMILEEEAITSIGGEMRFTTTDLWSSTEIIRKLGL